MWITKKAIRFRFYIFNAHFEIKTTNLCLIPNTIKLAQILFKPHDVYSSNQSSICARCTERVEMIVVEVQNSFFFKKQLLLKRLRIFNFCEDLVLQARGDWSNLFHEICIIHSTNPHHLKRVKNCAKSKCSSKNG